MGWIYPTRFLIITILITTQKVNKIVMSTMHHAHKRQQVINGKGTIHCPLQHSYNQQIQNYYKIAYDTPCIKPAYK
ncbi:MAG: hypothetical protein FP833_09640 [Atribacteria sp.]|nr:hypothetical protein [Candidatus Atribacteria bacterium]